MILSKARTGTQVITPFRLDEDKKRHLKLMGDLGQIVALVSYIVIQCSRLMLNILLGLGHSQ